MIRKPNIIIYRNHLLNSSETFISAQAESLIDFVPYYIGVRSVPGLSIPQDRILVLNQGKLSGRMKEGFFRTCGIAPGFVRSIQSLNPHLIHAHFGPDGVTALPLAKRLNVPLIVTFHGYDATIQDKFACHNSYWSWKYVHHKESLKQRAVLFIAVSDFIKDTLIRQGFEIKKVVKHYIGVNTEVFSPDPTIPREKIILFVGRLIKLKGCEYLIRAMEQVQVRHPDAKLVIIGDGVLRAFLEDLAHHTLTHCQFLGTQSLEEVRIWMNRARVLSVPSVPIASGATEGLGMVFVEAQAMGLPVVSFAIGGIPEAVEHERTGFLAPAHDWKCLADYISLLLEDDVLWHEFSQKGRERVKAEFDLQRQSRILEDIYKQVV